MRKNWILIIVILVILSIIEKIIESYYDIWSGPGLILSLLIGIPLLVIVFILLPGPNIYKNHKIVTVIVLIIVIVSLGLGFIYFGAFETSDVGGRDFIFNRAVERAFSRGCSAWITQYGCDINQIDSITLENYENPRTSKGFTMRELCEAKAGDTIDLGQSCFELCNCV